MRTHALTFDSRPSLRTRMWGRVDIRSVAAPGQIISWLREGMADWVACQARERLGAGTFSDERARAMLALAMDLPRLRSEALDLVDLGRPLGWERRHLRSGDRLTYRLAFLVTTS